MAPDLIGGIALVRSDQVNLFNVMVPMFWKLDYDNACWCKPEQWWIVVSRRRWTVHCVDCSLRLYSNALIQLPYPWLPVHSPDAAKEQWQMLSVQVQNDMKYEHNRKISALLPTYLGPPSSALSLKNRRTKPARLLKLLTGWGLMNKP